MKVRAEMPELGSGGIKLLKAMAAPYVGVEYIPTGGISAANLKEYLSQPFVRAVGGSWMVKGDLISGGEFDKIKELAAEAVALAAEI